MIVSHEISNTQPLSDTIALLKNCLNQAAIKAITYRSPEIIQHKKYFVIATF